MTVSHLSGYTAMQTRQPEATEPVSESSMSHGNLPSALSTIIGRHAESSEVSRLLASSRLVTLSGPGGVGKTRLALHVASTYAEPYPDGVWWIRLEDLAQPTLLGPIIAGIVGEPGQQTQDPALTIGNRRMLLVLDNCEHIVDSAATVCTSLLEHCPFLTILTTSQEPLHVEGESTYAVPPLPLPKRSHASGDGDPHHSDAVALFLARAVAANPRVQFSEADIGLIHSLCKRLDGLPLAIEMAAAATRSLPLSALATQQEMPHDLHVEGYSTATARHHTLRATLDYSYERCDEAARSLWRSFAVFRGGADLAAIESVCSTHEMTESGVQKTLTSLVDKSIVSFDGRRYRMLETIRAYGDERLREHGSEQEVSRSHHRHFATLAKELETGWFGPDQTALLSQAAGELANIRVAMEHSIGDESCSCSGLEMASRLWPLWIGSGLVVEGRHWLDRLTEAHSDVCNGHVFALWVGGLLRATGGDSSGALPILERCQDLATELDDSAAAAHCTQVLGLAELLDGRRATAIERLDEAVTLERHIPEFNAYLPFALVNLGAALCYDERVQRAVKILDEARELSMKHAEQLLLSWSEAYLGLAALLDGRASSAVAPLTSSLARKRKLQDSLGLSFVLELLSWAAIAHGDIHRAARLIGAVEALSQPLGTHLAGLEQMLQWHSENAEKARAAIGEKAFEADVEAGRALSLDDAIAFATGIRREAPRDHVAIERLTPREQEIAALVARGMTNKEIAAQLVVSSRTVSTHVEHILAKLGFRSRTQIAVLFRTSTPDKAT
ncbi:ATP-binding protein [Nocardioides sp. NPDC101246]|uniref:ATP-binding protein n=1 Tax=Nocardioides sp. NPDC101246 TaxID=3364336 RepID=UPI003810F7B6